MRERIDAYILLDFLEGWRTRLKTTGSSFRTSFGSQKSSSPSKTCPESLTLMKAHSKTYDNDKERPTESTNRPIEAVRDYMLDDLKKYDAASVKYQWMKRTGETVTMEVKHRKA